MRRRPSGVAKNRAPQTLSERIIPRRRAAVGIAGGAVVFANEIDLIIAHDRN
jgi:hypothetical protein